MEMEVERECSRFCSFSCASDIRTGKRTFSVDSYLASGSLKRILLRLDPFPTDYEEDTVELFGFQWVTETALVESCTLLFGLFRQLMYKLENLIQPSSADFGQAANLHWEAHNIRQQCIKFLQYVKVFIFRYLEPLKTEDDELLHPFEKQEVQLPSLLVEELHSLTLYIGRLFEIPSSILGGFSIQSQAKLFPPSWHLLHLHLDIHWSVLEILHILDEKLSRQTVYAHKFTNLTGENLTNISLFEQHCGNLLHDLISLSINRYAKVRLSEALSTHPYPCSCIKELWVLLIHMLDHRSKGSLTEPFWVWMNKILKNVSDKSSHVEARCAFESVLCKDPLSFSWWVITHLSSLYHFDHNGNVKEKKPIESNWPFVEDLLKQSVNSQTGILEEQLRMHLQCCLTLSHIWDANLPTVTILWEYYSKNLNSPFTIPWFGLKGLANISKTPMSMYELVKSCCSDIHSPDAYVSRNSYQIFLCILAQIMKKTVETNGVHPWKQIKGRIYSKFHQKRMRELTEAGLQNFFHLFLVLAAMAETEDVASRVMELLRFLSPASTSLSQRALLWKGCFAFILTYVEKSMDITVLAEHLSSAFREKAKEFLVAKNDYVQKQNLWQLLSTYIDGVQEVFETSHLLYLSEEKLLNEGFSMLLPGCRGAELAAVLNFVQDILSRLSSLSEVLTGVGHTSYQAWLVRSWLRCTLQMFINQPTDSLARANTDQTAHKTYMEQLTELTRLILKLPEVGAIFSKVHVDESVYRQDPKNAVFQFIKAVGKYYGELQMLDEKSSMVTKALEYLGDVLKYIKPYLMKKGPAEGLHLTYRIMGCLVKSWAPILATSKAQPLLFRIIDCLLLPHAVLQQDKGLPAAMLSAIRENLPHFLQGLSFICCQSQTQGAYLNQLLGNIIQQYFGRFLPSSPSASQTWQHPILLAISTSITSPAVLHLYKTILQVISENYLQFKGHAPPPRLASVLAFILEALQKTKNTEMCNIELLLPVVLKCLVLVNEPQVKKLSTEILQCVIESCQRRSGGELATQLTSMFRQFIKDYTTVYDNQVYSILEAVAVLDQPLVINLIPAMTEALRNSEYKQGLGRNIVQREAYKRLLSQLAEAGQAEILKLGNESH
ncbi:protein MMS22-like isoform X2 [Paroedura picta]|uniref:protein MMS22-like isoform X2 n=1 Tax=Paroedura picta TaxID=143630 RepID=UPI004056B576